MARPRLHSVALALVAAAAAALLVAAQEPIGPCMWKPPNPDYFWNWTSLAIANDSKPWYIEDPNTEDRVLYLSWCFGLPENITYHGETCVKGSEACILQVYPEPAHAWGWGDARYPNFGRVNDNSISIGYEGIGIRLICGNQTDEPETLWAGWGEKGEGTFYIKHKCGCVQTDEPCPVPTRLPGLRIPKRGA